MTAAGPAMMKSSHPIQPVEGAPLLREEPRQLVVVEVPALGQGNREQYQQGSAHQ